MNGTQKETHLVADTRQLEKQSMSFVFSTFPRADTDADTVPWCGVLRTVLPACSSLEACIRTLHHKFTSSLGKQEMHSRQLEKRQLALDFLLWYRW